MPDVSVTLYPGMPRLAEQGRHEMDQISAGCRQMFYLRSYASYNALSSIRIWLATVFPLSRHSYSSLFLFIPTIFPTGVETRSFQMYPEPCCAISTLLEAAALVSQWMLGPRGPFLERTSGKLRYKLLNFLTLRKPWLRMYQEPFSPSEQEALRRIRRIIASCDAAFQTGLLTKLDESSALNEMRFPDATRPLTTVMDRHATLGLGSRIRAERQIARQT
ncbi:hypothetical protein P152DRAFT_451212 [Eremomyces bilateralis CBS 781.70]|uniref:Uncharacterized protein n=1 Tax=Eremomyces bilateralis CBS 781.70 TaxID=1392243 RepID=A0A6G1FXG8_9PEZI|nr:uncharacterized protein P152DRAFT_451212 [Eremomyces bilateralis CBS 781.70]KAF1810474.1 hypothetical protein P152DRAFT_451212 [Eremomyces bilateralis CBS 781.70]